MKSPRPETFVFGEFRLEPESQILFSDESEVHLPKRPFYILAYLIENRLRVVSRAELLDKFWDGHDVYDDALRKCVGSIRKALKDEERPPRFIETRYGGGYRFIADVLESATNGNVGSNGYAAHLDSATRANGDSQTAITHPGNRVFRRLPAAMIAAAAILLLTFGFYFFLSRQQNAEPPNSLDEAAMPIRSIAVMPLKNLTGDASNEYFSDGVTESIITELSRVGELRIISRSSTFALKDKEIDPREIGTKLNVEALLEGSVQKRGDLLSVSVRLISTQDGRVLWTSQDFERPVATAYELQDTISCNIAIELRTELCDTVPKRNTNNADAYQTYLKGRYQWNKRTGEGIEKSIEHYKQAIALDPDYALAYAGLADSYVQGVWRVPFAPDFALPKAIGAAKKAIELDETSAEAHTALASAYQLSWDWEGTDSELKRAIELNPKYARAHHVNAFHLSSIGRYDEALASIKRAQELDPLNLVISADIAMILWNGRFIDKNRIDAAFEQCLKVIEMDANYVEVQEYLAIAFWLKGMPEKFAGQYIKAKELGGGKREVIEGYKRAYQAKGVNGIFRKELVDMLASHAKGNYQSPARIAQFYGLLGDKESAFKWLEKTFQKHNAEIVGLKAFPFYDPLRDDSRFADLLRRAGLPE